jgi:general secretion pathway protein C
VANKVVDRFSSLSGLWKRSSWYSLVFAGLIIALIIQTIRLIWVVITPLGPVGDWQSNDVQVLAPQSRLALFSSFDPFFRSDSAPAANVVTSLQLTLFGIRMNTGSGLGSAILAGTDGVQDSYAVGQEIQSGVTLDNVQFDHVVIDRGGVKESLYLDQSVPAKTVGGEESLIGASPAGSSTTQSGAISGIAGFVPRTVDGKITGIIVSPRGNEALFRTAGLRDGDIIVAVNGSSVTSSTDIENLKGQIKPGARFSVDIERGAKTIPIAINLGSL